MNTPTTLAELRARDCKVYGERGCESEAFRLSGTSFDHLDQLAEEYHAALGRQVSRSILVRRAIEVLLERITAARAAGTADSELAALVPHLRA